MSKSAISPREDLVGFTSVVFSWILFALYGSVLVFSEAWQGWGGDLLKSMRHPTDRFAGELALLGILLLLSITFTAMHRSNLKHGTPTRSQWWQVFKAAALPTIITALSAIVLGSFAEATADVLSICLSALAILLSLMWSVLYSSRED